MLMNNNIFSLKYIQSTELSELYDKAFKELNDLFKLNWVRNLPKLLLVEDRNTVNNWQNRDNTNMSGWTFGSHQFYVLDKETYIKEQGDRYKEGNYFKLIKHEMAHCFYQIITKSTYYPTWLWEGVAIYASGQNSQKFPTQFSRFLNSQEFHEDGVYQESGYAIELLVKYKDFDTLLNLLKRIHNEKLEDVFAEIYQAKLEYQFFNKLLNGN